MKRADKYLSLILLAAGLMLPARSANAGSYYSRYGFGLLYFRDGVKAIAMGGTGIAFADSVTIFYLNPASLGSVRTTHIQGAASYDRADVELGARTAMFHDFTVSGLGILIPLKRGYAVAFGLQPYSQVNYQLIEADTVDSKGVLEFISGTGGLNVFYLALGSTIGPLRLGLTGDFYFGLVNQSWRVNFVSGDYLYTEDKRTTNFRGFGLHGGVQLNLRKLYAGVVLGAPVNLSGETRLDTRFSLAETPRPVEAKLPMWGGAGLAYRPNAHWLFSAEARAQQWGVLSSTDLLGANGTNSYTLGFGLELTPGRDRLREGKALHYRLGANQSQLPYREANGNTILEQTVAAGFGVPFNRGASSVDFAFEWGKRGGLENIVQENIFRFSASINGSERWFQRRR